MSSLITDPTARFVVAIDASNDPDYPAINNKPLVWTNPFFVASPNTRISVKGVLGGAGTLSVYVGERPEAKILSVPGSAVSLLCLYDVNDPDPDGNAVTSCQAFPNDPDDYLDDGTAYITKSIQIPAGYSQLYYRLFSGDSYASLSASARGPDMIVGAQQPLQLTVAGARALETVGGERNDPLTVHVLNGVNLQPSDRVTFADSKTGASVRRTLLGDTGANLQSADVQFTMTAPDAAGLYVASLYRADANGNDGQLLAGGPYLSIVTDTQTLGGTDVIQYYDLDAIGSVRRITQVGTSTVIRKDYQPFGTEYSTNASTSIGDRVQFGGKERDPESGLDYSGARYYASLSGRFTTVDPGHVGGDLADPQSWNSYAYARNNPLRFVDTDGLECDPADDTDTSICVTGRTRSFWQSFFTAIADAFTATTVVGGDELVPTTLPQNSSGYAWGTGVAIAGSLGAGVGGRVAGVVAADAAAGASESQAFSYMFSKYLSSIKANGLRQGSYATPSGVLSPLQAQIELALPPNRGLPDALVRIDLAGMRAAGYEIPGITRVRGQFGLAGGGYEM